MQKRASSSTPPPKPIMITWTDADLDHMSEITAQDLTNAEVVWKRDVMAGYTNLLNAEDEPLPRGEY